MLKINKCNCLFTLHLLFSSTPFIKGTVCSYLSDVPHNEQIWNKNTFSNAVVTVWYQKEKRQKYNK